MFRIPINVFWKTSWENTIILKVFRSGYSSERNKNAGNIEAVNNQRIFPVKRGIAAFLTGYSQFPFPPIRRIITVYQWFKDLFSIPEQDFLIFQYKKIRLSDRCLFLFYDFVLWDRSVACGVITAAFLAYQRQPDLLQC